MGNVTISRYSANIQIEFWSELTIAILPWGNAELFFGQKYKLTFRLWEETVKI